MDTSSGRPLIHGGDASSTANLDDLGAYDLVENSWMEITPSGTKPRGRYGHVAVVDAARGKLLSTATNSQEDLWAYDLAGNSWTVIAPIGTKPGGRYGHVAVVDAARGKLLIHGGDGEDTFDDLWAYDLAGNSWTVITPIGTKPQGRYGHLAVVDATSFTITSSTSATSCSTATATASVTTLAAQISTASAICRPSAPALFYALFCVARLAIM